VAAAESTSTAAVSLNPEEHLRKKASSVYINFQSGALLSFLADFAYLLFFALSSPYFFYRMVTTGKYRAGLKQRLGFVPERTSARKCVWIHGVSVGEILGARSLVSAFLSAHPDWEIVLSTTTKAGFEVARKNYPDHFLLYFPLDFSWVCRSVLRKVRPSLVLLMELEIWPNFIRELKNAAVPVMLINGRLSEKSYRLHKRFWKLLQGTYRRIDYFCVQSETYAERLRDLGVPDSKIEVTGSMKYDTVAKEAPISSENLRRTFGLSSEDKVWVAGSTHRGEEEVLLRAYAEAKREFPELRFILVPRHPERSSEVEKLARSLGQSCIRRSAIRLGAKPSGEVILVDTLGELAHIYSAADVVFVGGSLVPHGGQNMLEPAAFGKAVFFGPHTDNFRDSVEMLLSKEAAKVVQSPQEVLPTLLRLLSDSNLRSELGRRAREAILSCRGATVRNLHAIEKILEI